MSVPGNYLQYPHRHYGMDHDRYPWSILPRRPAVQWPNGAPVAVWVVVACQSFPLNPTSKPVRLPGGMVMPYPDLRHFTLRDYGNRVGIFRVLRALDKVGLKASFAVNARLCERTPALLRTLLGRGDEIMGHGWDMDHPHHAELPEADERALVQRSIATLRAAGVAGPRGWLSPGRSESRITPELLAEAGIDYFADWVNDDMPYAFRTDRGPLVAMPLTHDLDDRQSLVEFCHTEADFALQIVDQYRYLKREAESTGSGRILALNLHAWVIGQPHRMGGLESALETIVGEGGLWSASGAQIADAWKAQAGAVSDPGRSSPG
jgi:peptidoglycan/xylan/chitin deacetylase (PgdA/CDA1 family)